MATQGHHMPETTTMTRAWDLTPAEIARDGLQRLRGIGANYRLAIIITAVLALIGLVAIVVRSLINGWGDRQDWTYVAVAFGYLMATVGSAPCLSAAMRLTRGHWRRPVNRIAEMWAAALIVPTILYFLIIFTIPGTEGRPGVWFGWPASPWLWDSILMIALLLAGWSFLYISSIPDFAIAREQIEQGRAGWYTRLAGNFFGTERQWRVIDRAVSYMGAFYAILYVGTMTVLTADLIQALIPGFKSAIFPAWAVITAFEGGVATVIITATVLRKWGGAEEYLEREQFFALAKLQLAFGLLYFYFTWTDFIIPWYGRMPSEINLLKLLYFDNYAWAFFPAIVLNFLGPLFVLMWTKIRRSKTGPAIAATGVLIGVLLDRIRLYSASFSTTNEEITHHELLHIPETYFPGILDILILVGAVGAALALVLLAFRLIPYPSIWEVTAGLRLRVRKRIHNTEVIVIAKPDF